MENRALKDHNLFKPNNLEEGKHAVVGDCNGFTMQQRWDAETPAFAEKILCFARRESEILDYGCGVGRLAKEILKQNQSVFVTGTDASAKMMEEAEKYVGNVNFNTKAPKDLNQKFDIAYLIYVLQHVPAIEIREILSRIHYHLKDDGIFIYCSSDYRMAIRYDGQGFFDDRFLGVDLQAEVARFFDIQKPLFDKDELANNPILCKMITGDSGGLAHPAFICKKRKIEGPLFNAKESESSPALRPQTWAKDSATNNAEGPKKLLLLNRLAPGDILVMTNAIRDLHRAHPGKYLTDVRTPCPQIFENNPYITKLEYDEGDYGRINSQFSKLEGINSSDKHLDQTRDILVVDMHYPMIHSSGLCGWHFSYGHRDWLEQILGAKISQTDIRPEIYLSQAEQDWPSPAIIKGGYEGKYWIINAGSKSDYTLKQYPYFQEVVDLLKDKIKFVQIGESTHNHKPLKGIVNMIGQTANMRELFRLIYKAEGVLTCVSLPMHIAAAFRKPCVVVAGAREGTRWELYPNHQFLYVNGCLPCAAYDGCWRSKDKECNNKKEGIPLCMKLIRPEDVARSIERYYDGGMLEYSEILEVAHE